MAREYLALVHVGALAAAGHARELLVRLAQAKAFVADPYLLGKLQELEARKGLLDPAVWDLFESKGPPPDAAPGR